MDFEDRWSIRGSANDLGALFRRAAEFLDSLGLGDLYRLGGDRFDSVSAVSGLRLDRDGDDVVLTIAFDHWQLPADLDYLAQGLAGDATPGDFSTERRDDRDFMVDLATRVDARTVVDFGCGTGQLAVMLAKRGCRVVAVDPARPMLDLARTREGAELVDWVWGDFRALNARDVDLAVMTGNIPSVFVTDEAWDKVLGALGAVLRPGGYLAFGSWNPEARPWETWGCDVLLLAETEGARVRVTGRQSKEIDGRGEALEAGSEWRYRTHQELTRSLTRSGFVVEQTFGDWKGSPLTPASPDIVLVASRR